MSKRRNQPTYTVTRVSEAEAAVANARVYEAESIQLYERLASLEMALETQGWRVLSGDADNEFSRQGLRYITDYSRVMALKNPLIERAVALKRLYVFGQDYNVTAKQSEIDELLTQFYDDPRNLDEIASQQAISQKEVELQTDGNLFFVFFVNQATGRVRVRSIGFDEIDDRIANPDDAREPWYYLRKWNETVINQENGLPTTTPRAAYYPDWRYTPTARPATLGGIPVQWDRPTYHVRVGGYGNWKFGLSEVYSAIDWALAYKSNLEDWAAIIKAHRKFAFQLTQEGGKTALAAAKAKLNAGPLGGGAANMPPSVGSTFISDSTTKMQPISTSGATVTADDARRLLLMVAAKFGFPETYFGDASVGTLATAQSLDRPTELAMIDRQTLWTGILKAIHDYVVYWAVKAPQGPLRGLGRIVVTVEDEQIAEGIVWNDGVDSRVVIAFPPIVTDNVAAQVAAIKTAATLDGAALAGTIELPQLAGMMLSALGVKDSDEILANMFPDGAVPPDGITPGLAAESWGMVEAVKELRSALVRLQEGAA